MACLALGCGSVEPAETSALESNEPDAISGRIVAADGRGIEGALVLVAPGWSWSGVDQGDFERCELPVERQAITDADGRFRLAAPPPGAARVVVRKRGFAELDRELAISPERDFALGELALMQAAILRGRVVDELGRGVPGAEIYRTWFEGSGFTWIALDLVLARTDDDGRFEIDVLPPGPYGRGRPFGIGARAAGFHARELELEIPRDGGSARWQLEEDGGAQADWHEGELVVPLGRGPTVRGRVNAVGGVRANWVLVQRSVIDTERILWGTKIEWCHARDYSVPDHFAWKLVPVDDDGRFTAGAFAFPEEDMKPLRRDYAVRAIHLTPIAASRPRIEVLGPTVVLPCSEDDREVELEVLPVAHARLRVVDAQSRRPLEELEVCIAPAGWVPRPIAQTFFVDGRVELGVHARAAHLWISAPGHRARELEIELERVPLAVGETVDLGELALEPAPELQVLVVDAETGTPIAGAKVEAREHPSSARSMDGDFQPRDFRAAVTAADGRARVNLGADDSQRLLVQAVGYRDGPAADLDVLLAFRALHRIRALLAPDPGERAEGDELRIELEPESRTRVRVLDAQGAPAAWIALLVDDEDEPERFTDERGGALVFGDLREVRAIPAGSWIDESPAWERAHWTADEVRPEVGPAAHRELELHLPPLVPVEVHVLRSGEPVGAAYAGLASWSYPNAPTDARGRVPGLERAVPGPLRLAIQDLGELAPAIVEIEIVPGVVRYEIDLDGPLVRRP